jgi:hypothetical protein
MTDYDNFAQPEPSNQSSEIIGIYNRRISGTTRIYIREIVSAAVGDHVIVFGEWSNLILPICVVAY